MKILSKLNNTGMIEETADKRYVTDAEKLAWNNKADKTYVDNQDALKADKTYVDNKVKTDVPAGAKFTDTVTTINNKTGVISKADIVALGIPSQDTNTTYTEITTAEIDAGTASTLRTITGRRVKYILDKVQEWIGGLTKSDVGLSNVDNTSDASKPISTATQAALNGKVNNSQVLTNVPSGAKFTDTITTINGKTGTITKADITALGIPAQDTVYSHPSSHPASMITESSTKRFVSDSEKSTWNSKSDTDTVTTINGKTGAISKADIVALGIPEDVGPIVDLGTFNDQTELITHVIMNQLPTGHYTFIMGIYPYFMLLREEVEYYKGTFQDSEGITVNFRVTKTGQINYLFDMNIIDSITDLQDFKVDRELGKGLSTNDYTTEEKNKLAGIETGAQVNTITSVAGRTGAVVVSKSDVGLSNVDNTSDLNKPISTATQTALNGKVDNSRVLTDVPLNAKFTDTVYTHPASHPASMITESSTKRFVTDAEKANWNNKWDYNESTIKAVKVNNAGNADSADNASKLGNFDAEYYATMPHLQDVHDSLQTSLYNKVNNSRVLTDVPANAEFTDTVTTINGKTGAISKDDIVALGIPSHNTTYSEITTAEIDAGNGITVRSITGRRIKYLIDKIVALFPTKTSELTNDSGFLTRWPTWSEVTSKPSTFAPSSHTHTWTQVTSKPTTATRWPTWSEVTSKPDVWIKGTSHAITESGSNTNGRYIRFSDGTLIMMMTTTANLAWSKAVTATATLPSSTLDTSYQVMLSYAYDLPDAIRGKTTINARNKTTSSFGIVMQTEDNFFDTTSAAAVRLDWVIFARW